jgi:hypothetical protein
MYTNKTGAFSRNSVNLWGRRGVRLKFNRHEDRLIS